MLSLVLQEWEEMLMTKDETVFQHRLKNGVGTAWRKIEEALRFY